MSLNTVTQSVATDQVDVRGPRFSAWVTSVVLLSVLIVSAFSTSAAAVILAAQAATFSLGAVRGPRRHPYGRIFATLVAPRLGPATEREPVAPLKFAQLVGLVFALAGAAGFTFGATLTGVIATGFALAAAFLNAAFGICLGCQIYPLATRLRYPTANPTQTKGR